MDLTIERNQLAEAVASVSPGLPARPQHPVHAGILVSVLGEIAQFTVTDGQVVMNCITDADSHAGGRFIFPRVFAEVAKALPAGEVRISVENFTGSLACGKARFTFPVLDGRDFPLPPLDLPVVGEADGPEFRMALRKVLPALDSNNATTAFTAIQMGFNIAGDITLVAADHYMIAVAECEYDLLADRRPAPYILIPGKVAEKFARTDGIRLAICLDDNRIQVRSGGLSVTSALLDEKFPAWEKAMGSGTQWTKLPEDLRDAVKRAALTLGEKEAVMLDFDQIALTVKADGTKGGFMEALQWDYAGGPVNLFVGHQLLLQALGWCDEVCVREGKPLLLRGRGVRYLTQIRRGS